MATVIITSVTACGGSLCAAGTVDGTAATARLVQATVETAGDATAQKAAIAAALVANAPSTLALTGTVTV